MKRNTIFIAAAAVATAGLILFTGCKEDPEGPPAGDGFTLTTTANPAAGGDVTKSPNRTSYAEDDAVLVTATAKPGYTFSGWSGAASGTTNPVTVIMDRNKSLTANFTKDGDDPPIIPPGGHWYDDDTSAATFYISTADELAELAQYVDNRKTFANKTIVLVNNIDLSKYNDSNRDFNNRKGWIPIGGYTDNSDSRTFAGIFDGNGKIISGLFINDNVLDRVGLFGRASGEIRDLGVEGVDITARQYVGGLVGSLRPSAIVENCYTTGVIRSVSGSVGGVAGSSSGYIINSYSSATISGNSTHSGGVAGSVDGGSLVSCYYTGTIGGINSTGGIAGSITGSSGVEKCYSTGSITGSGDVGGIAGTASGSSNIVNCYTTGKINGASRVGGVAGFVSSGQVSNCYSKSIVSGESLIGGVAGGLGPSYGHVNNCYSVGEVSGDVAVGGVLGGPSGGSGNSVTMCAALNTNLNAPTATVGRVMGQQNSSYTNKSGNVAFGGMTLNDNGFNWPDRGAGTLNGTDITIAEILADGTIGGRFTAINGWTIEAGKLPGLLGESVDLPSHLSE